MIRHTSGPLKVWTPYKKQNKRKTKKKQSDAVTNLLKHLVGQVPAVPLLHLGVVHSRHMTKITWSKGKEFNHYEGINITASGKHIHTTLKGPMFRK